MSSRFGIVELLNEIRKAHAKLPSRDEFPVHIEIISDDKSVSLHQYVCDHLNLTLTRYYNESSTFFDLELRSLLVNYLCIIKRD